jgi:hypothetical protein
MQSKHNNLIIQLCQLCKTVSRSSDPDPDSNPCFWQSFFSALSLTAGNLKGWFHEMNIIFKSLKSNQYLLLSVHDDGFNIFGCLVVAKIEDIFLHVACFHETLTNSEDIDWNHLPNACCGTQEAASYCKTYSRPGCDTEICSVHVYSGGYSSIGVNKPNDRVRNPDRNSNLAFVRILE